MWDVLHFYFRREELIGVEEYILWPKTLFLILMYCMRLLVFLTPLTSEMLILSHGHLEFFFFVKSLDFFYFFTSQR